VRLLNDIVKPQLSAYKHSKLTDQGTERLRPREPTTTLPDEINPPSQTISVLYWTSLHLDVLSPVLLVLTIEIHHPSESPSNSPSHSHPPRFVTCPCTDSCDLRTCQHIGTHRRVYACENWSRRSHMDGCLSESDFTSSDHGSRRIGPFT